MILLLLACGGGGDEETAATLRDWAGPVGAQYELIPLAEPDADALWIEVSEEAWELRHGTTWREAQRLGEEPRSLAGPGLKVGDSLLLPKELQPGASAQGSTIEGRGEDEVWYGAFPDVLTVTVGQGAFAGTAAFALDVGPIRLTFAGQDWELAGYQL